MEPTLTGLNPQTILEAQEKNTWKPLGFLNLYRLTVSATFVFLYLSGNLFEPIGQQNPQLFLSTSISYLLLGILSVLLIQIRYPRFEVQILLNVIIDIVCITAIMHSSGGPGSGIGILLIISVAGGSILTGGRTSLLFASLATIAVLLEQFAQMLGTDASPVGFTQAGLLGAIFFATAGLTHFFARRILESEALARKRGVDLANMAQLTEHIIQRMQTGIMVVDTDDHVRLINESAWYMVGMPAMGKTPLLASISHELTLQLYRWRTETDYTPIAIQPTASHAAVLPRFARISQDEKPGVLIFLEDTAALAQQAQQLKLASLGRLTASIAHEIRNPLGAISHAGQLLDESPNLDKNDQRLTRIISDQSGRVNNIVENIFNLSRRDRANPEVFSLAEFLNKFVNDFCVDHGTSLSEFSVELEQEDMRVQFDTSQLQQILTNLCENGLRHSSDYAGSPKIEMRGGISSEFLRPFLDIIDHGPGMDAETIEHIFEPFFTTESSGTGLGLYISRELAESNQATLNYLPGPTGGSCFRISFQDPRKQIG